MVTSFVKMSEELTELKEAIELIENYLGEDYKRYKNTVKQMNEQDESVIRRIGRFLTEEEKKSHKEEAFHYHMKMAKIACCKKITFE